MQVKQSAVNSYYSISINARLIPLINLRNPLEDGSARERPDIVKPAMFRLPFTGLAGYVNGSRQGRGSD